MGWIYGKAQTRWDDRQEKDVDTFYHPMYAATLPAALSGLLEVVTHESAAQSIRELKELILEFRREVREALREG